MAGRKTAPAAPELTDDERAQVVETYRHRLRLQRGEYGQWVATQDILVDGALAFTAGHPVPVAHVERFGYDLMVPPLVCRPDNWTGPASDDEAVAAYLADRAAEQDEPETAEAVDGE